MLKGFVQTWSAISETLLNMSSRPAKTKSEMVKKKNEDEEEWISSSLPKAAVRHFWPSRILQHDKTVLSEYPPKDTRRDEEFIAKAHYARMKVYRKDQPSFEVGLGDCVELETAEEENPIILVRIEELFEDIEEEKYATLRYFYQPLETVLACTDKDNNKYLPVPQASNRVWLATPEDNATYKTVNSVTCILRKVKVVRVHHDEEPPEASASGSDKDPVYWYDQTHKRQFFTFREVVDSQDILCTASDVEEWVNAKGRKSNGTADVEAERPSKKARNAAEGRQAATTHQWREHNGKKLLYGLELCCGGGGLSFLFQEDDKVKCEPRWAVDIDQDAIMTYSINHPQCACWCIGIDEFLMMSQLWEELCHKYPDTWKPETSTSSATKKVIWDVRIVTKAERGKTGQEKGQLKKNLQRAECWLEFLVHQEGEGRDSRHTWLHQNEVVKSYETDLARFVSELRKTERIPLPGQVDVVSGGPPCQGVSGLNRHAKREEVLNDPKNRLVEVYFDIVNYFKPAFTLMEQVLDILKKEHGVYARYATARILDLRYQVRMGVIAAGDHGCPEGRYRCIMWSAKPGCVLPSFPEPSHRVMNFHTPIPSTGKECHVTFLSAESKARAYPMNLMGDVLSDLPAVSNFCLSEMADYTCKPLTPFQLYIRRLPPPGTRTLKERVRAKWHGMRYDNNRFFEKMEKEGDISLLKLGRHWLCSKRASYQESNDFATQTWDKHLELEVKTDAQRMKERAEREAIRNTFTAELAKQVLEQIKLAREQHEKAEASLDEAGAEFAYGQLQDHRSLLCNADDYLRMTLVPSQKNANFRQMPGVVTNADGSACAGHCHAYITTTGNACAGGGTMVCPKSSLSKSSRVDIFDKTGWRGTALDKCPATTYWLPTGDLACPRWCITYKKGKSNGRHGCFGRIWYDQIQPTVVTRAEPHNLQLVHPTQDRVLSVRENARCQGFPDYWVLASGQEDPKARSNGTVHSRYRIIGNAVAPPVAAALGRCLCLAASQEVTPVVDHAIINMPDPDWVAAYQQARELGLVPFSVQHNVGEEGDGGESDTGADAEVDDDADEDADEED